MKCLYRPEWTCGKYNKDHKCAIFYNLIEGQSYYFEDESAEIVGAILSSGRNGVIKIDKISKKIGISEKSIVDFFKILEEKRLLTSNIYSKEDIIDYRILCKNIRKKEKCSLKEKEIGFVIIVKI